MNTLRMRKISLLRAKNSSGEPGSWLFSLGLQPSSLAFRVFAFAQKAYADMALDELR